MLHGDGTPLSFPKCYHIPTGESMSRKKFRTSHKIPENSKNNWRIYGAVFPARFQLAQRFCNILAVKRRIWYDFAIKKRHIEKENRRAYPIAEEAVILKEPRLHSGIPRHVLESFARCLLPDIRAFYASEEGRREFAEWKKKQQQEQQEQKENGPDEAR